MGVKSPAPISPREAGTALGTQLVIPIPESTDKDHSGGVRSKQEVWDR